MTPRLRHRVTVESFAIVRNTEGDRSQVWIPLLINEPAEVLTGAGKEQVAAGQPQSNITARVTMRWRPELVEPHGRRVLHDGAVFHVETWYADITGRRWITLVCSAGVRDD